jgi:hypothetical protein
MLLALGTVYPLVAQTPDQPRNTPTVVGTPVSALAPAISGVNPRHPVAPAEEHFARIEQIAADHQTMTAVTARSRMLTIKVRARELREELATHGAGDVVHVETVTDEGDRFLKSIRPARIQATNTTRVIVLLLTLVLVLGLARLLYGTRARTLVIGADGRYSKSKFQMAVWFVTLITTYLGTLILRARSSDGLLWAGIDIPKNLLLISGLSALSFAGAKGITSSKIERGVLAKPPQYKPKFPGDLLYGDDGKSADLGDFQMLVITGLATAAYLGGVFTWLGHATLAGTIMLPDVDTTILSAFGLGQGAYLAKKALETETTTSTGTPEVAAKPPVAGT